MSTDFPLPLAGSSGEDDRHDAAPDPWVIEPHPSRFIVFWPGQQPPTETEVLAALVDDDGAKPQLVDEPEGAREDVLWAGVYALARMEMPVIIWAERARPMTADDTDDAAVRACRWVVGLETILSHNQPYEEYVKLLHALASGFDTPAILDPETNRWSTRQVLADLAHEPPAVPPVQVLWTIHAVSNPTDSSVWLHTHGLWRCGCAELEMLEVPHDHAGAAAHLMNDLAQLALDTMLPPPDEVMEIGPDLEVALQPWQAVAPQVSSLGCGGMDEREGSDNPHAGVRAVVCDPKQRGLFRKQWTWPETAIRKLQSDEAMVYRTGRATQRDAELAQRRWPDLAIAVASIAMADRQEIPVLIKAGFDCTGHDAGQREHLWFAVKSFSGDRAMCELVNQPLAVAGLKQGDVVTVSRETVSDWIVLTPDGRFGPADMPAMWRSIDALRKGSDTSLPDSKGIAS